MSQSETLWQTNLISNDNSGTFNEDDRMVFECEVEKPNEIYSNMLFEWEIIYYDYDSNETIVQNLMNTSAFGSLLTQYENFLIIDLSKNNDDEDQYVDAFFQTNIDYTFQVTVSMDPNKYNCNYGLTQLLCDEKSSSNKTITINEAPTGGNCTILNGAVIYALETLVYVECDDWTDTDGNIRYSFGLDDGMY